MHARPVVLVACEPAETLRLRGLLPADASIVEARSLGEAAGRMAQGVDAIICSMDFDDSRMLDLVREAHDRCPDVPMLCCRVFGSRISDASLKAAAVAALSMGVGTFIDLANRAPVFGGDAAELANALVRLLG